MFDEFIKIIKERKLPVYGIQVMREGRLAAQYHFQPVMRHPIYSATKSFTSTAVGLAIEETDLSLEDSILNYLEEDLPKSCSQEVKDNLEKVTLKRLLTMSVAGYPFRPFLENEPFRHEEEDWLSYSISVPLDPNKKIFHYSNIPAYLVGVVAEKAVKQNLKEYLRTRLFEPLGIDEVDCAFCPRGHFYGASGMYLTIEELSKLGELYLQKGFWKGRQLISSKWIAEACANQIETREGGYGYFIWRAPENGYRISGKWGQRCFVFPQKELVITYLGNLQDKEDSEFVSQCMYETIVNG